MLLREYLSLLLQSPWLVVAVFWGLVLMSLISWSIIFAKLFSFASARKKMVRDTESFQEAHDLRTAIQLMGRDQKSPAYQVALMGVTELNKMDDYPGDASERLDAVNENLRRTMRQGVSYQVNLLGGSMSFLATCANAAPFIGLFGTVCGIMHSFHSIGTEQSAALAVVAPGISEALEATALGLFVAIPASIAYNNFAGRLSTIEADLVAFAGAFLNRVRRELPSIENGG
ncbi:MAG: protein TolQ [Desulfovibrio sp.]|nr:MAG: protein TolQ [Desulfovibrio sp.]